MDWRTFYKECVKRKVFKGISIYAISSWLIIQVAATTFPYLGFPNEAVTTVIILVLICFPVSIVFSWYYNVVPEPDDIPVAKSISQRKESSNLFFISIGFITVLVIVLIFLVSKRNFNGAKEVAASTLTSDQIAVLQFANNTNDEALDVVGKMVADWISHGIIQYEVAPVLSYESINQLSSIGNNANILQGSLGGLSSITSFSKLIKGSFFVSGGELVFQSEIMDRVTGKQFAFPIVRCPEETPLEGIEKIKQQVLAYFQIDKNSFTGTYLPRYDAYKEFILAKDYWVEDYALSHHHLEKALSLDPDFYQAAYYETILHYNNLQYEETDSLITIYRSRYEGMEWPLQLFSYLQSMLEGKYKEGYLKYREIFRKQPSDLFDNTAMLVLMYSFVNDLTDFDEVYDLINISEIDFSKCTYCNTRLSLKAYAEIEKGNAGKAQIDLEKIKNLKSEIRYSEALIKALVVQEKLSELDIYLSSPSIKILSKERQAALFYSAAWECALSGKKSLRDAYLEKALSIYQSSNNFPEQVANCFYLMEKYDESYERFTKLSQSNTAVSPYILSRLITIDYMKGRKAAGDSRLNDLIASRGNYDFGVSEYLRAHIAVMNGEYIGGLRLLEESLLAGKYYGSRYFQNDPFLIPVMEDPDFKKLLTYWH